MGEEHGNAKAQIYSQEGTMKKPQHSDHRPYRSITNSNFAIAVAACVLPFRSWTVLSWAMFCLLFSNTKTSNHYLHVASQETPLDAPKAWCGSHSAESCDKCGIKAERCGGDCVWTNETSVFDTDTSAKTMTTSTAGTSSHFSTSSAEDDPNGFKCVFKTIQCGDYKSIHSVVRSCHECSFLGSDYCTDPSCSWNPFTSLCRPKLMDNSTRTATVALLHDLHPPPPPTESSTLYNHPKPLSNSQDTIDPIPSQTTTANDDEEVVAQPAWFFQKVVLTKAADATFYGMNGHRYGYAGVQIFDIAEEESQPPPPSKPTQKNYFSPMEPSTIIQKHPQIYNGRILFSIWDPDAIVDFYHLETLQDQQRNNPQVELVACGSLVTCESNAHFKSKEQPPPESDDGTTFKSPTKDNTQNTLEDDEIFYRISKQDPLHLSRRDAKLTGYTATIENLPIHINEPFYIITQASIVVEPDSDSMEDDEEEDDDCNDFDCNDGDTSWIEYSGYVSSKGTFGDPQWRFLATIRIRQETSEGLKRDWWHHGLYSFIEQWEAKASTQERSALFGPGFVSGVTFDSEKAQSFHPILSAEYTFDTLVNHETVNAYYFSEFKEDQSTKSVSVGICTGGDAENDISWGEEEEHLLDYIRWGEEGEGIGTVQEEELRLEKKEERAKSNIEDLLEEIDEGDEDEFLENYFGENSHVDEKIHAKIRGKERVDAWTRFLFSAAEKPDELLEFASFIPCLNSAQNTDEIESCLQQ